MSSKLSFLLCLALPFTSSAFTASLRPHVGSSTREHRTSSGVVIRRRSLVVVQADALLSDDRRDRSRHANRKAWPHRIWSKIIRRETRRDTPLHMHAIIEETETLLESITKYHNEDFILRNFDDLTPNMVLPEVSASGIDAEFFDVVTTSSSAAATVSTEEKEKAIATRNISIAKVVGVYFENMLAGIIERNAVDEPEDLTIQAFPRGNVVASLMRGRFSTDAKIDVERLVFPAIRMSGGTLEIKGLNLNIMGFLPSQKRSTAKFLKQFEFHADNWTFSRHDLLFSPCIRNGLKRLLVRILRDRGVQASTIKVTSLDILPSGKISCKGEAKTLIGSPLAFEVRSGISFSSRGHVITFPGLEVSVNRDIGLFVPVVPDLDLDIGHNARFRHIEIDGRKKQLRLSADVTITPESTIRLNDYKQSSEAFSARFFIDVGRWFTRIGNFTQ